MIINITGTKNEASGTVLYELPKIYFDQRFAYKIGVQMLFIEMDESEEVDDSGLNKYNLLCLNTNLVDRSSANPTQTILHFWHNSNNGSKIRWRPPSGVYFGLHLFEFENSTFDVITTFDTKRIDIKNIFIQLEVVKVDPYGRVQ